MFSLQKFLGKGEEFFDLFEASAQKSIECLEHLKAILLNSENIDGLSLLRKARRENKELAEKIDELVVRSFVTVLEREDIEALARALYKIPKPLEKFAERFVLLNSEISTEHFQLQIAAIDTATTIVSRMVKELRKGNNLAKIKGFNARLHEAEEEADTLELKLMADLYNSSQDPMKAIIMADFYELLEKVIDYCRDAGNVITHIFLKNS